MNKTLATKLKIKPDHAVLVVNSPNGLFKASKQIDTSPSSKKKYHALILFAPEKATLDKSASSALRAVEKDALIWIAYPKKSSGIKTDITRDYGWDAVTSQGFEGVSIVSLDDTWTAFRFRPVKEAVTDPAPVTTPAKQVFTAALERASDNMDATYVSIPFDVEDVYGTKGMVKVKALFDGYPYRGILSNMGTGSHIIIVRKDIRSVIGKKAGDKVKVQIELDTDERTIELPEDLEKVLNKSAKAKSFFDTLSFTNRKEYVVWITSAKREETKSKRLKEIVKKLVAGKKNPTDK